MKNGLTALLSLFLVLYRADLAFGTSAPSPCEGAYQTYLEVTRIDQVEDRLWAVHASDYIPADGTLKPNLSPEAMSPTVHFSIGELVPPHMNGSWEQKKYAFLVPLKELYPKAANLMAVDTFIIGGIKLPKNAVVVAPKGTSHLPPGVKVFEYDPAQTTLRQAVASAIEGQGGIRLATSSGEGGEYSTRVLFEQAIRESEYGWDAKGPNVNSIDFLEPALAQHPGMSYGTHNRSVVGDAARLGQIAYFFQVAAKGADFSPERLAFLLTLAETNLKGLDRSIAKMSLPADSVAVYKEYRKRADQLVQKLRKELAEKAKPIDIDKEMASRMPFLSLTNDYLRINLSSLKHEDLKEFAAGLESSMPGLLQTLGGEDFLTLSWVYARYDILLMSGPAGKALMEKESLKKICGEAMRGSDRFIESLPESARSSARYARQIITQSIPSEWKQ